MKHTITITCGEDASEFKVSLCSVQEVCSFIDKEKYALHIVGMHGLDWHMQSPDGTKAPVDCNDFSFGLGGEKMVLDLVYTTIYGAPGEDGRLQGCLDTLHVLYSCYGALTVALTYGKFVCNQYLKAFGVCIADSLLLRQGQSASDEDVIGKIGLPCFVKSSLEGFSFGVIKIKIGEEIQPAIEKAFRKAREALMEAFMQGVEIACDCYKTKGRSVVLPIMEVASHNEYSNYKAKHNGGSDEIAPACIPDELRDRVQKLTPAIYDILSATGIIRMDYIITEGEKINLLGVNTTPGMTVISFTPQQVRAAGLDIKDMMTDIIENRF